ncbi:hypothetical protein F4604DRAFT_2043208 [Suillus subluteus]|nr:hypothetical protein F4604DRAFT_2043208 [Suillus subluteus]
MSSDGRTPLLMLPSHITRSRFMAFDAFPARKAAHWSICAEYMPMPTKLDNGEVITALRLFVMLTALQEEFIGQEIVRIREICGPRGRVIGVVSGGVDSTVTAKLMREAIGDRGTPHSFHNLCLTLTRASDYGGQRHALNARLWGVFETDAAKIEEAAEKEENGAQAKGKIEWLLEGALYPDVIGSISFKGPSATTTTHRNVGGLLKDVNRTPTRALQRSGQGNPVLPIGSHGDEISSPPVYNVCPQVACARFAGEMAAMMFREGLESPRGTINLTFDLDHTLYLQIARWAKRKSSLTDLEQSLCVVRLLSSPPPFEKLTMNSQCSWPTSADLSLRTKHHPFS